MTTVKGYTDVPQSRKLAEFLSLESADMHYATWTILDNEFIVSPNQGSTIEDLQEEYGSQIIPCWSLASLLEQLPYELCDDDGNSAYLQINKDDDMYQLAYEDPHGDFDSIETDRHEHFVDACYELLLKVHENNLL